jgi:hypothetical protein
MIVVANVDDQPVVEVNPCGDCRAHRKFQDGLKHRIDRAKQLLAKVNLHRTSGERFEPLR